MFNETGWTCAHLYEGFFFKLSHQLLVRHGVCYRAAVSLALVSLHVTPRLIKLTAVCAS